MERVMGIEPTLSAWEAEVLPLNYTRLVSSQIPITGDGNTRAIPARSLRPGLKMNFTLASSQDPCRASALCAEFKNADAHGCANAAEAHGWAGAAPAFFTENCSCVFSISAFHGGCRTHAISLGS
jgi:hypothetical protein